MSRRRKRASGAPQCFDLPIVRQAETATPIAGRTGRGVHLIDRIGLQRCGRPRVGRLSARDLVIGPVRRVDQPLPFERNAIDDGECVGTRVHMRDRLPPDDFAGKGQHGHPADAVRAPLGIGIEHDLSADNGYTHIVRISAAGEQRPKQYESNPASHRRAPCDRWRRLAIERGASGLLLARVEEEASVRNGVISCRPASIRILPPFCFDRHQEAKRRTVNTALQAALW